MQVNTKSRTIVYSILLSFSVSEVAFGVLHALTARVSVFGGLIGLVMAIVAFVMIIWTSILLAYNNRPVSTHKLARVKAHALSLLVFAPFFFLLSVMLTVNAPFSCITRRSRFELFGSVSSCAFVVVAAVQGWIIAILSTITAACLLRSSKLDGFEKNITCLEEDV